MNTDLTFITNEKDKNLSERFKVLIKDTKFFDVLVGYFYTSGFYAIYKSLENTEKVRILIGISTNRDTYNLIQKSYVPVQESLQFSHAEAKEKFSDTLVEEMGTSEDNHDTEEGVNKFLEWLKSGKLEIKAYPSENIHAKLYVMTFAEGDRDVGRVITGSSNFTQAGLIDNLEFNVELKTRSDYEFAQLKFNELWENAVDVSEKYIETIQTKTWLNNTITPYDLYLKFLYEYFKDEISRTSEVFYKYVPTEFKKLEYQEQAVLNAKKILGMVLNSDENTNKGAFAKDDLISEVKTDVNTKPYIEGKYLKKYLIEKTLFLEWDTKRVPHLLSRPTFPELYNRPKIMRGRVTEGTYDDTGLVSNDSILLFQRFADLKGVKNNSIAISIQKFNSHSREELENISLKFDLKYLLAIINSQFANVYLNNIRRHRLENYFYPDDFRNLPIAEIPLSEQKQFIDFVDKIIDLKKSSLEKDKHQALDYEKQIDQLVYKLYDLTDKEKEIVENA